MRYLITLRLAGSEATLAQALEVLRPSGLDVDTDYGLVCISPKRGLHLVRAEGAAREAEAARRIEGVESVHGDIRIASIDLDNRERGED